MNVPEEKDCMLLGAQEYTCTGFGVFVQACWVQHKRKYPDELIQKEIEEFHRQSSVWWYNLSDQERDRFIKVAEMSNSQQAAVTITTQALPVSLEQAFPAVHQYPVVSNASYVLYQGHSLTVGNMPQHQNSLVTGVTSHQVRLTQKPMKDPNSPKRPLSAFMLFSQEERMKVMEENPDFLVTDVAKELGKKWAAMDRVVKGSYEERYQEAKKLYDKERRKHKKDPHAPKQPLSAYLRFSAEQRLKVKAEHPDFSFTEIGRELGRRWGDLDSMEKQEYLTRAEVERVKYVKALAMYKQGLL